MGRMTARKMSKNEAREGIASYISLHPGTSFGNIKTIFKLADGTLRYHLRYLERRGQIRMESDRRVYFPTAHLGEEGLSGTQLTHAFT